MPRFVPCTATAVASLVLASSALAQAPDSPEGQAKRRFRSFDMTEDGWLDGKEVDACACAQFDTNGDREITWDEYKTGALRGATGSRDRAGTRGAREDRAATPGAGFRQGERVQIREGSRWLHAVIVEAGGDPERPYLVHHLGTSSTYDVRVPASELRPEGSGPADAYGSNPENDPVLLKLQGRAPAKAAQVPAGSYECYALSGGRLSPALALNFRITGRERYLDSEGRAGTYAFDATAQRLVFRGAALDGVAAVLEAGGRSISFLNARGEKREQCDHAN